MADSLEKRLREKLNAMMRRRGRQAAIARKITTHGQAWLSRYLSGELGMDLQTLEEIAHELAMPVEDLLLGAAPLPDLTPKQRRANELAALFEDVDDAGVALIKSLVKRIKDADRGSGLLDGPTVAHDVASGTTTAPKKRR